MDKVVLISIPETSLRILIEQAVKNAMFNNDGPIHGVVEPQILTFTKACEYIGISKSHGYKLTSTNQIPHSKRGRRLFFDKAELDKWLLGNKVKTTAQLTEEANAYLKAEKVR